ncbi:MAG TPA: PKD domain-containing protein [Saprospiraceae bacterium]|nr:PKD domain-containing protein [Saprospiraceae bacterium]
MRIVWTSVLTLLSFCLWAQPVYQSSDYGTVNSEITFSGAAIDSVLINNQIANEGANASWDFSDLQIVDQFTVSPETKAESGYQIGFITTCIGQGGNPLECNSIWSNDVDYAIPVEANFGGALGAGFQISQIKIFRKLENDLLTEAILGLEVNVGQAFQLGFAYNEYDTIYQFPLEFGKRFTHPSSYDLDFTTFGAPFAYLHDQIRSSLVDSYGSLETPYGSFDNCLRMATQIQFFDTLLFQGQPVPLPRTEIIYEWFQSGFEAPVLEVRAIDTPLPGPLSITSVQFYDSLRCLTPNALFVPDTLSRPLTDGVAEFQFFNQSTLGSQYEWDFGDGNSSTAESPTHGYTAAGEYTVTLTVCNEVCDPEVCTEFSVDIEVTELTSHGEEQLSDGMDLWYNQSAFILDATFPQPRGNYEVFDATGALVLKGKVNQTNVQVPVNQLSNGFYVLRWVTDEATAARSWMKY